VIDVSGKIPAIVRRSVRALAEAAERYLYVSTVQVYRDWPQAPVDETSLLWHGDPGFDPGTRSGDPDHGPTRAGCEIACRDTFGSERLLILRLHVMVGTHEYIGPLRAWLERMRRGGPVLVPSPDRVIQPIDVRDAATFLADQVQRRAHGVFNVGAPPNGLTYGTMVRICSNIADAAPVSELVWANEDWLMDQGVKQWTELPLWRHAPALWSVAVDRAVAAGLRSRSMADTVADAWRWLNCTDLTTDDKRSAEYGMAPTREAVIIARWRAESILVGARSH
jgi:nucleoside-diphosphate-sugar epimerase